MIVSQHPPEPPVDVPFEAHLILWPALALWMLFLIRLPGPHRRMAPPHEAMLVCAAFLADASVVVSGLRWPAPNADSFKLAVLWFALGLSLTVYLVLRAPRDDGDDGPAYEAPPEPPWWPDFERGFRDYARSGQPRPRSGPRVPVGTRS